MVTSVSSHSDVINCLINFEMSCVTRDSRIWESNKFSLCFMILALIYLLPIDFLKHKVADKLVFSDSYTFHYNTIHWEEF